MRLAALFSGGKDSTYAARLVEEQGHEVPYMVSLISSNPDSYMFHTVNINITELQTEALNKVYIKVETTGEKDLEILDLTNALISLDIDGVITGAIASNYQKQRIDKICKELELTHYSPLWGRDRVGLVQEMLDNGMEIIFSSVAAHGLDEKWLGERLDTNMLARLSRLNRKFGVDPCGEGGEYESLVLDAPWFKKRIKVIEAIKHWDGVSGRFVVLKAVLS